MPRQKQNKFCKFHTKKSHWNIVLKYPKPKKDKSISIPFSTATLTVAQKVYGVCCEIHEQQLKDPMFSYVNDKDMSERLTKLQQDKTLAKVFKSITQAGLLQSDNSLSVHNALQKYYEANLDKSTTTWRHHQNYLRFWQSQTECSLLASDFTSSMLFRIVDAEKTKQQSHQTIVKKINWLKLAFQWNARRGNIKDHISNINNKDFELERNPEKPDGVYLDGPESPYEKNIIGKIFDALKTEPEIWFQYKILVHTGRRFREQYEICWKDFETEMVQGQKIVFMNLFAKKKSKAKYRQRIPLAREVVAAFEEYRMWYLTNVGVIKDSETLWPTKKLRRDIESWENGRRDAFHKLTHKKGIYISQPFRICRRTFEKNAWSKNKWSLETLADYCASSPQTIVKHYLNNNKMKENTRNVELFDNHLDMFTGEPE